MPPPLSPFIWICLLQASPSYEYEPQTYKTEIIGKNLKITSGKSNKESVYHKYYDPILEKIIDQNKLGRNPDEVIRKILKIVNKKQVKLRYLVGPSTKLKYALKYFLPFEIIV